MIFADGSGATCTASLISKGLLVTAAHCLAVYGEGSAKKATDVYFVPAQNKAGGSWSVAGLNAAGPYGAWRFSTYSVPTCYVNGTCSQQSVGAVGSNDVAVVQLAKNSSGEFPWQ